MTLWIPGAERQLFGCRGKSWRGGTGKPKLVLHTIEGNRWPRYNDGCTAPHCTFRPADFTIRQHIPFSKSAYSLRENALEDDRFTYQVEMWGFASQTPDWPDEYYRNLARLIRWFHDNLGVPLEFVDFSRMKYGKWAPQRMEDQAVRDFSGVMGHAHFGRDVDTHWDPGRLQIPKLQHYLGLDVTAPPSEPIPVPGVDIMYPFWKTDGYDKPTAPGRTTKRDDVLHLQRRMNTVLAHLKRGLIVEDGKLGDGTLSVFHNLIGSEVRTEMIDGAEGADFDAMYAQVNAVMGLQLGTAYQMNGEVVFGRSE